MGSMVAEGEPPLLAPAEELGDGLGVGGPGVGVADVGGEELEEAAGGLVAGVGDEGGDDGPAGRRVVTPDSVSALLHPCVLPPAPAVYRTS